MITEDNSYYIIMGNKSSLPEEGREIFREYETFLDGKKRISTSVSLKLRQFSTGKFIFLLQEFTERVRKNLQREQKSSSTEEQKIRELFSDKSHIEYRDFLYFKLAMVRPIFLL